MKKVIYLLLLCGSLNAQINTLESVNQSGANVTSIYPEESMVFVVLNGDSVFVNIVMDVISNSYSEYSIYVYFPNTPIISNYDLVVVLDGGASIELNLTNSDWTDGYFEYRLTSEQLLVLENTPINGFLFESGESIISCVTLSNQYFFINFLNNYGLGY
jgi:hypothetical protein